MALDDYICNLPIVGFIFRRLYSYSRKHLFFTEFIHILFGIGIGLVLFTSGYFFILGIIFIILDLLGHAWAFVQGKQ